MKKSLFYISGLLIGLAILVVGQLPSSRVRVVACDVGQGDAILIIKGETQVLVDGGPSGEKILACLADQLPFWDRRIELIVLTNTDYDHMNGLSTVVERYQVIHFATADGVHASEALTRFAKSLSAAGLVARAVSQGDTIKVGVRDQLRLEVLWPPQVEEQYLAVFSTQISEAESKQILGASAKKGDLNERSVVLQLTEGSYRALLMGDSGFQTEKTLLSEGRVGKVDYLKVGHHGSKYASSQEFVETIRPDVAVVSVGSKNRYGHPTTEALSRLGLAGGEIYRTDQLGTIVTQVGSEVDRR